MSTDPQSILTAALTLPDADRAMIAERLMDSLPDNDVDGMTDEEFEAELERRHEEAMGDPSVMIPWTEFDWDAPS